MPETDINISLDELDLSSFDRVVDISTSTEMIEAFSGAHRTTYLELTGDPGSIMKTADRTLIVCDVGARSRTAAALLRSHGYLHVYSLEGGVSDYVRLQATTGVDRLSPNEVMRYDRQIRLAGFGLDGQRKLRSAIVTVVGAGGLGCPALIYLAAAGVGSIRLVDHDVVDLSNLQRQPLYATTDVTRPKVEAAAAALAALNPEITTEVHNVRLTGDNASELVSGSSVVIDATDNFAARYVLNRTTVDLGIPLVYGSVYAFDGQMAVFDARSGPCYQCLFPDPPTDDAVLDCATIGVLGAVTGVIGSLQASAALQLAAGLNSDVTHSLTMFDARQGSFEHLPVAKRPDCAVCGP
jgi:molybdopterin/thiamine biosynthesis adenylyltransferase/rhodanese-related sulfurtransferase